MLKILDRLINQWENDNNKKITKTELAKQFGIRYESFDHYLYIKREGKVFCEIAQFFNLSPEEFREMIKEEMTYCWLHVEHDE